MKNRVKTLLGLLLCMVMMGSLLQGMMLTARAEGEKQVWDCPECGRTGNKGNYCGGCAHPAPWIESEATQEAAVAPAEESLPRATAET